MCSQVQPHAAGYHTSLVDNHGHVPVMRERMAELLAEPMNALGGNAVIVDGTLGAGGHAEFFLSSFPHVHVIGIDRDASALCSAEQRLARFGDRLATVHARFDVLEDALTTGEGAPFAIAREHGLAGAFFDLGVSSMQLDQVERGFAYRVDSPLDMRMDPSGGITAADVLNTYSHGDLARVLKEYGDERFAGRIASEVVRERKREPFRTSARLVEVLYRAIPAAARRTGGHPAKRTFQALRVEVNRELDALRAVIPMAAEALAVGGRAVFMSYQSHEDRMVKRAFSELTRSRTPEGLPIDLPGTQPCFHLVTRGAEQADAEEREKNPRAASVRVRAIERTRPRHSQHAEPDRNGGTR